MSESGAGSDEIAASADLKPETRSQRRWRNVHSTMLDAVWALVSDALGTNISVTDVAARADVAQGTFYNHFSDIEAALDETVNRDIAEGIEAVELVMSVDMDAVERIAIQSAVMTQRLVVCKNWCRFVSGVYRADRDPRTSENGARSVILNGLDEGVFSVSDVELSYRMWLHLHLATADFLVGLDGDRPPLALMVEDVLGPGLVILGVDLDRVPALVEWVLPKVEHLSWG